MGGVAGHLAHLYDNRDLTYNKMAEILTAAARGELVGTEKTDGFNIYLGFVDGQARAARNKGDMSRGGMTMDELSNRTFQGGERAKRAYVTAFQAYKKATESLSDDERAQIFGPNGEIFYNTEIQGPLATNVVNYDRNVLSIHRMGHKRYNIETNQLDLVDTKQNSEYLDSVVDRFEEATADESFSVQRTAYLTLNKITDETFVQNTLNKIQESGYTGDMTINDYLEDGLTPLIEKSFQELDKNRRQLLVDRILGKEGAWSLTQIAKGLPREEKTKISEYVKKSKIIIKELIEPIELAIHDFAVELLKGLQSAYILDSDQNQQEVERLKQETADAIRAIQSYRGPEYEHAHDILAQQLIKLKHHSNIDTVVEGFAFQYDGQMYKFTGNFAPMNQLLGLFKYGRGKIPKMEKDSILEQNEGEYGEVLPGKEVKIGLVPMSAKPYHAGHHMLVQLAGISEITDELRELELPVNDIVGVFISFSGRGIRKIKDPSDTRTLDQGARKIEDPKPGETPIFGSDMEHIWQNILKPNLELPEKVKLISPAEGASKSPVRNIHDICAALKEAYDANEENFQVPHMDVSAPVNQTVINIYSDDKDIVQNYSDDIMEEYGELWKSETAPAIRPIGVPREKTIEISGTKMREFLCQGDVKQFSEMLPPLPEDKKQELANILIKSIECGMPLQRRELQEAAQYNLGIFLRLIEEEKWKMAATSKDTDLEEMATGASGGAVMGHMDNRDELEEDEEKVLEEEETVTEFLDYLYRSLGEE